jgi:hypothetical protein
LSGFNYKPFQQVLISVEKVRMQNQSTFIRKSFEEWKKDYDQADDVCAIAVRI